jgi:hypothetical protein
LDEKHDPAHPDRLRVGLPPRMLCDIDGIYGSRRARFLLTAGPLRVAVSGLVVVVHTEDGGGTILRTWGEVSSCAGRDR